MWIAITHQHPYSAGVADDDGADFQQGQAQEQPQTNPNTLASGAWAVPKNENEENKEEDPYKFDPTNAWG